MMEQFLAGAMTMGYFLIGLFFLRFWYRTQDRLFLFFALAFWLLTVQRAALGLVGDAFEDRTVFYLIRLAAYVLILIAIFDKNRAQAPRSQ